MTSAGTASMREVGLEIGNTIGLSTPTLMVSMTSLVNAPCTVDAPSRIEAETTARSGKSNIFLTERMTSRMTLTAFC